MRDAQRDRARLHGRARRADREEALEVQGRRDRVVALLVDGLLYFGSWDKKIYALDVETHKPVWSFKTGDKVKDGAAFARGLVFMGSCDGSVYALDARSGQAPLEGLRAVALRGPGNWYATPTIAYGRVFIGNTDGKMYAFGLRSGKLLWATSTGGYVYSSAAVSTARSTPAPTTRSSTPSTRPPATFAGSSPRAARSPALRR